MTLRDRVDPELLDTMDFVVRSLGHDFMGSGEAPVRRARFQAMLDRTKPSEQPFPSVRRTARRAPQGANGPDVPLVVYSPTEDAQPRPAIFYIHGGAFSLGSIAQEDAGAAGLAYQTDCVVVSVDYRLAPETKHPGPVGDCFAGLHWLGENAAALGVDPTRIAVYGHSAGGGLAALVAQMARDRGGPSVCYQMLCYPMLDDRAATASMTSRNGLGLFDRAAVVLGWSSLLGGVDQAAFPYGAAARADRLDGLPAAYLDIGELDVLLDEALDYVRRLADAAVPVEFHLYPGAYHGFDMFSPGAAVAARATQLRIAALRRALRVPSTVATSAA